jgi:serine/threonine protein kinase
VPNPTPGTILGAYRVEGQLGAGSMGEVFRAVDTGLERRVAIKLLSEKHRDSPELRKRFVREGRAVAAISHPNVVQVFATGSFDDRPYIAMELLDGIDLGSAVEKHGALSALEAAHAVLDAAQGLSAA